jgi:hypothetical protein
LADVWLIATDPDAVATAAQAIDTELGENAPLKGNGLSEGLRSLFSPPLKAIFAVREEDRIVEVLRDRGI